MRKVKIKMTITKEEAGYSAYAKIGEDFIATQGDTFEELKEMIHEAVDLTFENKGAAYAIEFEYDLESFLIFIK